MRPALAARVAVVARLAAELGIEVHLVGGTVRDLLLGRDSPDLDFVAVGDGLALAAAVHRELGGRLLSHAGFLTADVIDAEGVHLDVATARRESYPAVAALPEVRPAAALAEDLRRRDFTINCMALQLQSPAGDCAGAVVGPAGVGAWAALVDPLGGQRDLDSRVLRVLHERSFLDDPTRVLRGVRFEVRLGFRFAPETEALVREAIAAGAFSHLSGSRLRHEIELTLSAEPVPAAALASLARLADLGVLAELHPRLVWDAAAARRLRAAADEHAWYLSEGAREETERPAPAVRLWLLLLMALAAGLAEPDRAELAARLLLAGEERRLVSSFGGRLAAAAARLGAGARPSAVDAALAGLADEELLLLAAGGDPDGPEDPEEQHTEEQSTAKAWVRRYLTALRPLTLAIRGADLLAAGARPGPEIGEALRLTREARLDGRIGGGEELAYALGLVHP